MCPYTPYDDLTKERAAAVKDGTGTSITSAGNRLDVNAVVAPGPGGLSDFFSAEVDETGAPLAPIPPPPGVLLIPFIDFATLLPFTSRGVIISNNNPVGGADIWFSFAGGGVGTYHRLQAGHVIAIDDKGATNIIILDGNPAGGSPYSVHAWG